MNTKIPQIKKRAVRLFAAFLSLAILAACQKGGEVEFSAPSFKEGAETPASSPAATEAETAATSPTEGEESDPDEAPELPEDFRLSDCLPEFEEIDYCGFYAIGDLSYPQADEAAIEIAVAAYRKSELYAETIGELKEFFSYENGELTCTEGMEEHFLAARGRYLDPSAAPELVLKPEVVKSFRARFDGEREASLILLRTALPETELDWSGSTDYHIPVYVSADGEATILYDACRQDYGEFRLLCSDGGDLSIFALFGFGHNEGGQGGALYSFAGDKPKLELSGGPLSLDASSGILLGGYGWSFFEPILYDLAARECFIVGSVEPNEELAALLCADPTILADVPDAWEIYQRGLLQIIGRKYITFGTGNPWNNATFVYDRRDRRFERVDQPIASYAGAYHEQEIKTRYIDLRD
ncbi:MAG: hypothetical protein NC084_08175 [Bacteroides sp.]|nr:hypothetical protein [Eubacterium sp.]MCM1418618.1 hypothetical protein [Roseburia sp.]MCM1462672.1 hypothetical protein [Bacteroides sp.]